MMASRSFHDGELRPGETTRSNGAGKANGGQPPLAHHPDFRLGAATVRPSLRTVEGPAGSMTAEPRVIRVLLALADAGGAVLTRDDLTAICWDGLIVGDDSINRAIFELRRIARQTNGGFGVETIPRVGYRLTGEVSAIPATAAAARDSQDPTEPNGASRRWMIGGALAAVAAAGTGWELLRPRQDPRVAALVLRGEQAVRDELPDSAEQGVGFLQEAVAIEPANARAWGLLALAWRNVAENAPPDEVTNGVDACEAAAQRALALDGGEANALAALATLRPAYGDWLAAEDRLRRVLAVAPDHAWSLSALGILMESVGRSRESARLIARAAELEPLSPVHQYRLTYKHWILGRVPQADQVIDRAVQLWPRHPAVLFARFLIFVYTGRHEPARAMLDDVADRKAMMPARSAALWRLTLRALATRAPADVAAARDAQLAAATRSPGFAIMAIQMLALLSDVDAAFAVAEGYLLRRGPLVGSLRTGAGQMPVNDQRWRKTLMLFVPSTAPLRADPRFWPLVDAIGMVDYWRRRNVTPDYLRRA